MPSISYAIMCHPSRLEHAKRAFAGLPNEAVKYVVDPSPEAGPATLRTARLAWRRVEAGSDFHVVLQDDAILAKDFDSNLRNVLAQCPPRSAVSLYTEWSSLTGAVGRVAALQGSRLIPVSDWYLPTLALGMPASACTPLADFLDRQPIHIPDDVAVHQFCQFHGLQMFVTVPTLVQHDSGLASVVGNAGKGTRLSVGYLADIVDRCPSYNAELWPVATLDASVPFLKYRGLTELVVHMERSGAFRREGIDGWLHREPSLLVELTNIVSWLTPSIHRLLGESNTHNCMCPERVARHVTLLSRAVRQSGTDRWHATAASVLFDSLLPGVLRLYHSAMDLQHRGMALQNLLNEIDVTHLESASSINLVNPGLFE